MTAKKLDLETVTLKHGSHKNPEAGLSLLEMTAYLAGLPHSDAPPCTSPVLAAFGRRLNDSTPLGLLQRAKPFAERLIGTVDPEKELVRACILAWAAVTEFAPAALRFVKDAQCDAFADQLEKLTRYDWVAAKRIGYEARDRAREVRKQRWSTYAAADAAAAAAAAAADAATAYAAAYAATATAYAAAYAAAAADAAAAAAAAAYAAAYAAAAYAAAAADAAAAAYAAAARVQIFDLALAAFDRAIRCEEPTASGDPK